MPAASPLRPPTGRRIAESRQRLGLAHADLAERLGMSVRSYQDLESYDDEAFVALSVRQVCVLADVLHVPARGLVSDDPHAIVLGRMTPDDVAVAIRHRLAAGASDVDSLGEELVLDVATVLRDPDRIWDDWCLDGLRDVCAGLGLDWRAMLPDGDEPTGASKANNSKS